MGEFEDKSSGAKRWVSAAASTTATLQMVNGKKERDLGSGESGSGDGGDCCCLANKWLASDDCHHHHQQAVVEGGAGAAMVPSVGRVASARPSLSTLPRRQQIQRRSSDVQARSRRLQQHQQAYFMLTEDNQRHHFELGYNAVEISRESPTPLASFTLNFDNNSSTNSGNYRASCTRNHSYNDITINSNNNNNNNNNNHYRTKQTTSNTPRKASHLSAAGAASSSAAGGQSRQRERIERRKRDTRELALADGDNNNDNNIILLSTAADSRTSMTNLSFGRSSAEQLRKPSGESSKHELLAGDPGNIRAKNNWWRSQKQNIPKQERVSNNNYGEQLRSTTSTIYMRDQFNRLLGASEQTMPTSAPVNNITRKVRFATGINQSFDDCQQLSAFVRTTSAGFEHSADQNHSSSSSSSSSRAQMTFAQRNLHPLELQSHRNQRGSPPTMSKLDRKSKHVRVNYAQNVKLGSIVEEIPSIVPEVVALEIQGDPILDDSMSIARAINNDGNMEGEMDRFLSDLRRPIFVNNNYSKRMRKDLSVSVGIELRNEKHRRACHITIDMQIPYEQLIEQIRWELFDILGECCCKRKQSDYLRAEASKIANLCRGQLLARSAWPQFEHEQAARWRAPEVRGSTRIDNNNNNINIAPHANKYFVNNDFNNINHDGTLWRKRCSDESDWKRDKCQFSASCHRQNQSSSAKSIDLSLREEQPSQEQQQLQSKWLCNDNSAKILNTEIQLKETSTANGGRGHRHRHERSDTRQISRAASDNLPTTITNRNAGLSEKLKFPANGREKLWHSSAGGIVGGPMSQLQGGSKSLTNIRIGGIEDEHEDLCGVYADCKCAAGGICSSTATVAGPHGKSAADDYKLPMEHQRHQQRVAGRSVKRAGSKVLNSTASESVARHLHDDDDDDNDDDDYSTMNSFKTLNDDEEASTTRPQTEIACVPSKRARGLVNNGRRSGHSRCQLLAGNLNKTAPQQQIARLPSGDQAQSDLSDCNDNNDDDVTQDSEESRQYKPKEGACLNPLPPPYSSSSSSSSPSSSQSQSQSSSSSSSTTVASVPPVEDQGIVIGQKREKCNIDCERRHNSTVYDTDSCESPTTTTTTAVDMEQRKPMRQQRQAGVGKLSLSNVNNNNNSLSDNDNNANSSSQSHSFSRLVESRKSNEVVNHRQGIDFDDDKTRESPETSDSNKSSRNDCNDDSTTRVEKESKRPAFEVILVVDKVTEKAVSQTTVNQQQDQDESSPKIANVNRKPINQSANNSSNDKQIKTTKLDKESDKGKQANKLKEAFEQQVVRQQEESEETLNYKQAMASQLIHMTKQEPLPGSCRMLVVSSKSSLAASEFKQKGLATSERGDAARAGSAVAATKPATVPVEHDKSIELGGAGRDIVALAPNNDSHQTGKPNDKGATSRLRNTTTTTTTTTTTPTTATSEQAACSPSVKRPEESFARPIEQRGATGTTASADVTRESDDEETTLRRHQRRSEDLDKESARAAGESSLSSLTLDAGGSENEMENGADDNDDLRSYSSGPEQERSSSASQTTILGKHSRQSKRLKQPLQANAVAATLTALKRTQKQQQQQPIVTCSQEGEDPSPRRRRQPQPIQHQQAPTNNHSSLANRLAIAEEQKQEQRQGKSRLQDDDHNDEEQKKEAFSEVMSNEVAVSQPAEEELVVCCDVNGGCGNGDARWGRKRPQPQPEAVSLRSAASVEAVEANLEADSSRSQQRQQANQWPSVGNSARSGRQRRREAQQPASASTTSAPESIRFESKQQRPADGDLLALNPEVGSRGVIGSCSSSFLKPPSSKTATIATTEKSVCRAGLPDGAERGEALERATASCNGDVASAATATATDTCRGEEAARRGRRQADEAYNSSSGSGSNSAGLSTTKWQTEEQKPVAAPRSLLISNRQQLQQVNSPKGSSLSFNNKNRQQKEQPLQEQQQATGDSASNSSGKRNSKNKTNISISPTRAAQEQQKQQQQAKQLHQSPLSKPRSFASVVAASELHQQQPQQPLSQPQPQPELEQKQQQPLLLLQQPQQKNSKDHSWDHNFNNNIIITSTSSAVDNKDFNNNQANCNKPIDNCSSSKCAGNQQQKQQVQQAKPLEGHRREQKREREQQEADNQRAQAVDNNHQAREVVVAGALVSNRPLEAAMIKPPAAATQTQPPQDPIHQHQQYQQSSSSVKSTPTTNNNKISLDKNQNHQDPKALSPLPASPITSPASSGGGGAGHELPVKATSQEPAAAQEATGSTGSSRQRRESFKQSDQASPLTTTIVEDGDTIEKGNQQEIQQQPNPPQQPSNRSILILRDIEPDASEEAVRAIFESENCPSRPTSCQYALLSSWYVAFADDEQARKALNYIRKFIIKWREQPIMARYKTKPGVPSASDVSCSATTTSTTNQACQLNWSPSSSTSTSNTAINLLAPANGDGSTNGAGGSSPTTRRLSVASSTAQHHLSPSSSSSSSSTTKVYYQQYNGTTGYQTDHTASQYPPANHHHHQSHYIHGYHHHHPGAGHHQSPPVAQTGDISLLYYGASNGPIMGPYQYGPDGPQYDFSELFAYNGLSPMLVNGHHHHHHQQQQASSKSQNIWPTVSNAMLIGGAGSHFHPQNGCVAPSTASSNNAAAVLAAPVSSSHSVPTSTAGRTYNKNNHNNYNNPNKQSNNNKHNQQTHQANGLAAAHHNHHQTLMNQGAGGAKGNNNKGSVKATAPARNPGVFGDNYKTAPVASLQAGSRTTANGNTKERAQISNTNQPPPLGGQLRKTLPTTNNNNNNNNNNNPQQSYLNHNNNNNFSKRTRDLVVSSQSNSSSMTANVVLDPTINNHKQARQQTG